MWTSATGPHGVIHRPWAAHRNFRKPEAFTRHFSGIKSNTLPEHFLIRSVAESTPKPDVYHEGPYVREP